MEIDGRDTKEQLGSINILFAEFRGQVEANPALIQGGQLLGIVEELQASVRKLKETWGAEIEAASCPECGALVGWDSQTKEIYEMDFKGVPAWSCRRLFDFDAMFGERAMVRVRQCPACGHTEEVGEAEEEQE